MKGNSRKGLGAILAGVGMTTLLGVMSGTGVVRASTPEPDEGFPQDPPAGDGTAAPTEAEVTMKERCIWYVSGVANTITLTADALEDDTVYDGDQYSLSTTLLDDYVAWTSGNDTGGDDDVDAHAACTFFGEQTGIAVVGEWSDLEFTAEAQNVNDVGDEADDSLNMGFVVDGTDPLTFNLTTGTCRAYGSWSVGPNITAHVERTGSILTLDADDATERPDDAAGSNDKCNAEVSVTASIPAGQTPLYAGKAYKFTGPTFTTNISIDSVRTP
jgi:hypothetical protein